MLYVGDGYHFLSSDIPPRERGHIRLRAIRSAENAFFSLGFSHAPKQQISGHKKNTKGHFNGPTIRTRGMELRTWNRTTTERFFMFLFLAEFELLRSRFRSTFVLSGLLYCNAEFMFQGPGRKLSHRCAPAVASAEMIGRLPIDTI